VPWVVLAPLVELSPPVPVVPTSPPLPDVVLLSLQAPLSQRLPAPHASKHWPQWRRSLSTFTQLPSQRVRPKVHGPPIVPPVFELAASGGSEEPPLPPSAEPALPPSAEPALPPEVTPSVVVAPALPSTLRVSSPLPSDRSFRPARIWQAGSGRTRSRRAVRFLM
jgi:hypothetical protein